MINDDTTIITAEEARKLSESSLVALKAKEIEDLKAELAALEERITETASKGSMYLINIPISDPAVQALREKGYTVTLIMENFYSIDRTLYRISW